MSPGFRDDNNGMTVRPVPRPAPTSSVALNYLAGTLEMKLLNGPITVKIWNEATIAAEQFERNR